jgi:hypothetical protein
LHISIITGDLLVPNSHLESPFHLLVRCICDTHVFSIKLLSTCYF